MASYSKYTIKKKFDGKIVGRETRWKATVRKFGHPTLCKSFATKDAAMEWAAETEDKIRQGKSVSTSKPKTRLSEYLEEYITKYRPTLEKKRKTEGQIQQQLRDWQDRIGEYSITRIDRKLIKDTKDRMAAAGMGKISINRRLAALSVFFKWLIEEEPEIISDNPVKGITKYEESDKRVRFLTDKERERLFKACKNKKHPAWLYPFVVVACYTGMRQGEILAMRWNNVDLAKGWIIIPANTTKTGKLRKVPVRGPALEALRDWNKRGGIVRMAGSVFELSTLPRKPWNAAMKEAKLVDFRFHDLRHTAASYLVQSGVALLFVGKILGHTTWESTLRYSHPDDDNLSEAMDNMTEKRG